jgi:hypothetical protein
MLKLFNCVNFSLELGFGFDLISIPLHPFDCNQPQAENDFVINGIVFLLVATDGNPKA